MREAITPLDKKIKEAFEKQLLSKFCRITFEDYEVDNTLNFFPLKVALMVSVRFTFCSKEKCKMEIVQKFHYAKSLMIPVWENYSEQLAKEMLNDLWSEIDKESEKSPGILIEISLLNSDVEEEYARGIN